MAARVDALLPVSGELGPIAAPLERAARPAPEDRASALEFGQALAAIASKLPLPERIETLQAKRFEDVIEERERTGEMQRPDVSVVEERAPQRVVINASDSGIRIAEDTGSAPLVVAAPAQEARHRTVWMIGALIAMSPAYAAIAAEGFVAIFQVTVLAIVLALLVGFPTVVLFDTKPKD